MSKPLGLAPEAIAAEVAEIAFVILDGVTPDDWCPSLLFPLGYFEREAIERVEIIWGVCRVTVPNELVQIHFNLNEFPPFADRVRRALVSKMSPLLEGSGRVCQLTPEGLVIVLGQDRTVEDRHETQSSPPQSELGHSEMKLGQKARNQDITKFPVLAPLAPKGTMRLE